SVIPPTSIGARILGQKVEDRFGTAVAADGTFLYMSAPNHTSTVAEVASLGNAGGDRAGSGAVYQLRTNASVSGGLTVTQLWIEPGSRSIQDPNSTDPNDTITVPISWPNPDVELPTRTDTSMPVPHQYIVKDVGSLRGTTNPHVFYTDRDPNGCP